ncbi:MAG: IS3 family transposase [Acidimicrobiia bacterium]|nr:IS3 family transposase [Acidimicrobiia bacterium]
MPVHVCRVRPTSSVLQHGRVDGPHGRVLGQRPGRVLLRFIEEGLVHRTVFSTRRKARDAIAEYIEIFYNRRGLHSGIGYRTPLEVFTSHQASSAT